MDRTGADPSSSVTETPAPSRSTSATAPRCPSAARVAIATGAAAFDRLHADWVEAVGRDRAAEVEEALGVLRDALTSRSGP